jgi:hypothetical protein
MPSVGEHGQRLAAVRRQNLDNLRSAQQEIWNDRDLSELARAVVGLTGSQELLTEYEYWGKRVEAHLEEPAIKLTYDGIKGDLRGAIGGIIRGKVSVQRQGNGPERGRSAVHIGIPVYSVWESSAREPHAESRRSSGAVLLEAGCIRSPGKADAEGVVGLYDAESPADILIGWEELYESEHWTSLKGLTLAIQQAPRSLNPTR